MYCISPPCADSQFVVTATLLFSAGLTATLDSITRGRSMDIVQEVLKREQEALSKFKPITVDKHLAVENDLGLLLCIDPNDLDQKQLK